MFKWGYAKQVPMGIIQYAVIQTTGRDLEGYKPSIHPLWSITCRSIMDAASFARIIKTEGNNGVHQ